MAISEYRTPYRRSGEMDALGVEPLPPTPITAAAEKTLLQWGLSARHIAELREFCARFRYDCCLEKIQQLVSNGLILEKRGGVEVVVLPHFYDIMSQRPGQCYDIGQQFLVQAQVTGLMEDINEEAFLPPGCRIALSYCTGRSPTHFIRDSSCHIWNGLILFDRNNQIIGSVLIDASFQIIATDQEDGYECKTRIWDTQSVRSEISKTANIGWIDIDEKTWRGSLPPAPAVLGISNDRKYIFALNFARNRAISTHSNLQAVIVRAHADAKKDYFLLNPSDGELLCSPLQEDLSAEEELEIRELLRASEDLTVDSNAPLTNRSDAFNDLHHIAWDEKKPTSSV
jgi:hypothetical protein